MMKQLCMIGLAATLATPAAFAGDMPAGSVAGHVTMLDADFDDGTGFGIRGWASVNGPWFVHGEYSMVGLETPGPFGGADVDVNQLRMGGGLTGEIQKGMLWLAKAEYIDLGSDFDADGFGVHGGVMFQAAPALGLFGTLGLLDLGDDDGLELNFGASYSFTREVAGILDYRAFSGDGDLTELRLALAYLFY